MLLLKFQKEKYLEPIQQGVFHFSPIQNFRDDPTPFRGDAMEGILFGNPTKPFVINGIDISPYLESLEFSNEYEGRILSLSFSKLDLSNCHKINDDIYTLNDDFIDEMSKFGTSFITINPYDFLNCITNTLKTKKCSYTYHSVFYCNKKDYDAIHQYFAGKNKDTTILEEFFIKDKAQYELQNEWRFLIYDSVNEFPLTANGGADIRTTFRTEMPIFKTELLSTLRVSRDFLA